MEPLQTKPFTASKDKRINQALTPGFERFQALQWMKRNTNTPVTLFDEVNNADVCLCSMEGTRVYSVIARIYDAERNTFNIL